MKQLQMSDRGVLAVRGEDARTFLQGLISNDVEKVTAERSIHAAFLTAQGKYLFDFFVVQALDGDGVWLECEAARLTDFARRLKMYKLRSKVSLEDISADWRVWALFGSGAAGALSLSPEVGTTVPIADGIAYTDPRHAEMGARMLVAADAPAPEFGAEVGSAATRDDYDRLRMPLGIPDGPRDMELEKALLLECGFDELNGVDWDKGCYMGQELTARTKYRGLIKKRLLPVTLDGVAPESGTPITAGDREVGELRSSLDGQGLALVRIDRVEDAENAGTSLVTGEATVRVERPDWVKLPATA